MTLPAFSKSLLRTRRYSLYWVSSLFSNIGTWMQQVAQPWIILSISHSSFWVGADGFAMNAPGWVFTLWGGMLADRFDRKRIILTCQAIQCFCIFLLLTLLVLGKIQIWIILISSFVVGTTDALSMPAFQSIIPSLVQQDEIPRAVALNSAQFNLSRVLGPAFAGVMIATFGATVCYGANLISYLPFFLSLYWIYPRNRHRASELRSNPPRWNDFVQILRDRKFRTPLATILVTSSFCSPIIAFCPVLIQQVFHGTAGQLGWSMACFGLGGVLGAMVSSILSPRTMSSQGRANIVAAVAGTGVLITALISILPLLNLLLAFTSFLLTMSNTAVNSIVQRMATDQYRGRVASLFQLALHGGIALGSLVTGATASLWGIQTALLLNGSIMLTLQIFILARQRPRSNQINP